MLFDKSRAALGVATRMPRHRLDEDFHLAISRHAEQTEAEQATQLAHPWIMLTPSPTSRGAHGKPDLIAGSRAIHSLQDKVEREAELQLADDDRAGFTAVKRHQIAAAYLTLDLEAQSFEEAFDRQVEARFQGAPFAGADETCGYL